jgi:sugar lactone lactonase YvrE
MLSTRIGRSQLNRLCMFGAMVAIAAAQSACRSKPAPPKAEPPPPTPAPVTADPPPVKKTAKPGAGSSPQVMKECGFKTPESILLDADRDIYLVSNINGQPTEKDNNGFISRVSPEGRIDTLKWIEGGRGDVTLNAPKGMAIRDGVLYVTDIDTIRMFAADTGDATGQIRIKKATFLNDLALAPDGTLFVSDTGFKPTSGGSEPTGTDAIYTVDRQNNPVEMASGKALNQPNGLLADDQGVFVVTFGGSDLYRISRDGKVGEKVSLPKGSLDGLARDKDGYLLISSWEASTVYRGKPEGPFSPVVKNVKSPADIVYDSKRHRVVIPLFLEDAIQISPLPSTPRS